ncbi:peroxiredoxin-like 2C [Aulostomus maculatus]
MAGEAEQADGTALTCVRALRDFTQRGKALLDLAERESRRGSLQEFIRQKIRIEQKQSLLGLMDAAAALYRRLSVRRKKELEELLSAHHQEVLQAAVRDLGQLEVQWDAFLQHLDEELQLSAGIPDEELQPKCVAPDVLLTDARTGDVVTLQKYLGRGKKILLVLIRQFSCLLCRLHLTELQKNQASLDALSVEVVVVSFGCGEGASHWLQETGCPYDMLLDTDRKVYAAFGLQASLKKVLNFANMMRYAEYLLDDLEFPRGLPSVQDDMFQLGGDFVVDQHGTVLFSHCCQTPIDRPAVEDILSAL